MQYKSVKNCLRVHFLPIYHKIRIYVCLFREKCEPFRSNSSPLSLNSISFLLSFFWGVECFLQETTNSNTKGYTVTK